MSGLRFSIVVSCSFCPGFAKGHQDPFGRRCHNRGDQGGKAEDEQAGGIGELWQGLRIFFMIRQIVRLYSTNSDWSNDTGRDQSGLWHTGAQLS